MGIEPTPSAWKAEVLPLNYTRHASPVPTAVPPLPCDPPGLPASAWPGGGGRIRTYEGISRQIYSLLPLAAWVPLRGQRAAYSHGPGASCQRGAGPGPEGPAGWRSTTSTSAACSGRPRKVPPTRAKRSAESVASSADRPPAPPAGRGEARRAEDADQRRSRGRGGVHDRRPVRRAPRGWPAPAPGSACNRAPACPARRPGAGRRTGRRGSGATTASTTGPSVQPSSASATNSGQARAATTASGRRRANRRAGRHRHAPCSRSRSPRCGRCASPRRPPRRPARRTPSTGTGANSVGERVERHRRRRVARHDQALHAARRAAAPRPAARSGGSTAALFVPYGSRAVSPR